MIISDPNRTIFALSTTKGQAALAIIRISGKNAKRALQHFQVNFEIPPNIAKPYKLYNQHNVIDQVLLIFFQSPKSFTGEDLLEIQSHGGHAVVQFILKELGKIDNFFMAKPGEFAQRAMQNNKMNLLQVEALGDLLNAKTEQQLLQASRQTFSDEIFKIYDDWLQQLLQIMSHLEAFLAFPEEDIDDGVITNVMKNIAKLQNEFANALSTNNHGEIIKDGFNVAIVGRPNSGKSTLLNHLMQREIAIVSEIAGTTRDVLSAAMNLDGFLINFFDTAGLRDQTEDKIEQIGIKKAKKCIENANLIIFMQDCDDFSPENQDLLHEIQRQKTPIIYVLSKADESQNDYQTIENQEFLLISSHTGKNIESLLNKIREHLQSHLPSQESGMITRERHRQLLQNSLTILREINAHTPPEISSECFRLVVKDLDEIIGKINTDDVLNKLFKDFCIGK